MAPARTRTDYSCLVVCEKATSLLNQTNRVSASGTYRLPWGFMLSAWAQFGFRASPYNVTTGVDNNGDGNNSDRPVVNGVVVAAIGAGAGCFTTSISPCRRCSRSRSARALLLRAESFNTFNHLNTYSRNGVYGNAATPVATFGMPVGGLANVGPPREMQFSARIQF